MTKKLILALLLMVVTTGVTFAELNLSAGIGGTFGMRFSKHSLTKDGEDSLKLLDRPKDYFDTNSIGGGFFAFFDATYAALSAGMSFYDVKPVNSKLKKAMKDDKETLTLTTIDVGLLGKYPISLGGLTVFPAVGADFKIALDSVTNTDGTKTKYKDSTNSRNAAEWLSTFWFKAGLGADIPLGAKLYLRPMAFYGIGLPSKEGREANKDPKLFTQLNHGFDASVAAGFKF